MFCTIRNGESSLSLHLSMEDGWSQHLPMRLWRRWYREKSYTKKHHRFTSTCLLYNVSYVSLLGDCNLNVYLSHPVIPAVANTLTYSYLHYLQGMNATCHKTISLWGTLTFTLRHPTDSGLDIVFATCIECPIKPTAPPQPVPLPHSQLQSSLLRNSGSGHLR